MSTTTQPFRFLDLPKELRLMVYEHLHTSTVKIQQIHIPPHTKGEVAFNYIKFSVGVLATGKLIRAEAEPCFIKIYETCALEMTQEFTFDALEFNDALQSFSIATAALSCAIRGLELEAFATGKTTAMVKSVCRATFSSAHI